jgi:hypothetical protein
VLLVLMALVSASALASVSFSTSIICCFYCNIVISVIIVIPFDLCREAESEPWRQLQPAALQWRTHKT